MEWLPRQVLAVVLWIIWCALHSLLITDGVTGCLQKRFGRWFRYYRLAYNLTALTTLVPVALYSMAVDTAPVFRWEGRLAILRYALISVALGLFGAGARHYRLSKVVGIDQIRTGKTSRLLTESDLLSTSGIHGLIRHPWYAGALLLVWTREVGWVGLFTNIVLSLYLVIGALLEESRLVREFGASYRDYQKRVSLLIPLKWLKSK
jgi:methanethiol S-methyltransferase